MVAVHYYAEPGILFEMPCSSFLPVPNVDSSVTRLTLCKEPAIRAENETGFFSLMRTVFGQRRKTMLNSVSAGLSPPKETASKALNDAGLDYRVRAERLTVQEFARLYICPALQKE